MSKQKKNLVPLTPLQAAQRTLDSIDPDIFWAKVLKSVAKNVEINERIRFRSWAHAVNDTRRY